MRGKLENASNGEFKGIVTFKMKSLLLDYYAFGRAENKAESNNPIALEQ